MRWVHVLYSKLSFPGVSLGQVKRYGVSHNKIREYLFGQKEAKQACLNVRTSLTHL